MGEVLFGLLCLIAFPLLITVLASWVIVHPQEEAVVLYWGKFRHLVKEPGLHWLLFLGRKVITISTKRQTLDLPRTVVADGNGNPVVIAGVVTFRNVDSVKVALEVANAHDFVKTQAMAVLKQTASKYPYESREGHSLKAEAQAIGLEMVKALQAKVDPAGVQVLAYELSDLSYAPEIAQAMLIRQQSQALIDARKIIVEGAVEIVHEAVEMLTHKGFELGPQERSRLVTNLLTVICGEARVQPTYPIQGEGMGENDNEKRMIALLEKISANTTPRPQ